MNEKYIIDKIKRINEILDNNLNEFDSGMSDNESLINELRFYQNLLDSKGGF
jgi:hypothetical protein